MTAQTLTLSDFLLARIAEKRAACPRVTHQWQWSADGGTTWHAGTNLLPENQLVVHRTITDKPDPRVLAECEALRRIVEMYSYVTTERRPTDRPGVVHVVEIHLPDFEAEPLLSLLALPYADHPDYREEWRP